MTPARNAGAETIPPSSAAPPGRVVDFPRSLAERPRRSTPGPDQRPAAAPDQRDRIEAWLNEGGAGDETNP